MLGMVARGRVARDIMGFAGLLLFVAVYWMLLSSAWLLTLIAAAIGGIIAALVTGDLWSLGIVLVAGTLSGWLATQAYILTVGLLSFLGFLASGRVDTSKDDLRDRAAWVVGPAVAVVLAIVAIHQWM
jgi:hypothetical protein